MDKPNWKSRLHSKTIQGTILVALVAVINAVNAVTGMQIDAESLNFWAQVIFEWWDNGLTIGLCWMIYKGRMRASKDIMPWQEEVKTLINLTKGK